MRISIVGKQLEAVVAVNALRARTGDGVRKSVCGDVLPSQYDRVGGSGILRLQCIAGFPEVSALGADIAHFKHPLAAERPLNREVPLLRVGHNEMPRHSEAENSESLERAW